MTSTIGNATPSRNETDTIQRIDFNAEQPPRHFPPTDNDIMPGSTIATVTSSQLVSSTGNATTLVSSTQIKESQTLSQSQGAEVFIKARAQTGNPTVSTNLNAHDDSQKRQISTSSNIIEYPIQTPFNQDVNAKTDSELSTSLVSEAATVITIATPPIPVPADSPRVLNISKSSNIPTEIRNGAESFGSSEISTVSSEPTPTGSSPTQGFLVSQLVASSSVSSSGLPSTRITNAETKANTEAKVALDVNMNPDSRSNHKSDMEIDDELLLQTSPSGTVTNAPNSNINTAISTPVFENISVTLSRLNGDHSVPLELVPTPTRGGATNDITKVDSAPITETGNEIIAKHASVFQPLEDPSIRAGVEHALRSLVAETAVDSGLVLRLAKELKKAKNQSKESEGNATGSQEDVQPPGHVQGLGSPNQIRRSELTVDNVTSDNSSTSSALVAQYTRAKDEIVRLRQQLSQIKDSYNNAVLANQKFEVELSSSQHLLSVKLNEIKIVVERNRQLEGDLSQSQNQRYILAKRCETLQNDLNKSIDSNNKVGPGALAQVNRIQSQLPMKPPIATGNSTTPINHQHAVTRRSSTTSSHSVLSGSVDTSPATPSQVPRQGMTMLTSTGAGLTTSVSGATARVGSTGSTPAYVRNGNPAFTPHRSTGDQQGHGTGQQGSEMILTPPAQVQFQYQLQQMNVVGQQRQQQTGYTYPAPLSMGQLSPVYQQQQTAVHHQLQQTAAHHQLQQIAAHHQLQLLNQQNAAQNYSVGRYEQTLRQQAYFLPGMVPRDAITDRPPGDQPSQSVQGHMQTQLRKDLPLVPLSESGVHRTQPTPPILSPQQFQLPFQPQPRHVHIQTVSSFGQSQLYNMRGSQPQPQRDHVSVSPSTPTLNPNSPITPTSQANPHTSRRQSQEISLQPNAITAWRPLAPSPPAPYPFQTPQSYVVSPSQVSAQLYTHPSGAFQTPPVTEMQPVPQDTQLTVANTSPTKSVSRTVIDLTMDESEGTEIEEPPKKRQRVEETRSQGTVAILTEAGPALDEKLVVEGEVESTVVNTEPPVETVLDQVNSSTTTIIAPNTEPQPDLQSHLLIDGLDILSEETTELLTQVFEYSENDSTLRYCFFCMSRHQDDAAEWPEITRLKNPAVEDMVNHLKEIHATAWEKICHGEFNE